MKKILTLLVVCSIGFAAVGCDPKPADEPNAAVPDAKTKPSTPTKAEATPKTAS